MPKGFGVCFGLGVLGLCFQGSRLQSGHVQIVQHVTMMSLACSCLSLGDSLITLYPCLWEAFHFSIQSQTSTFYEHSALKPIKCKARLRNAHQSFWSFSLIPAACIEPVPITNHPKGVLFTALPGGSWGPSKWVHNGKENGNCYV